MHLTLKKCTLNNQKTFYKPLRENQLKTKCNLDFAWVILSRLAQVRCFPALGTGCMFPRALYQHISRAWHRMHVFPRFVPAYFSSLAPYACFPALDTTSISVLTSVCSPFVIRVCSIKNFTVHYLRECACLSHHVVHSDWLISRLRRQHALGDCLTAGRYWRLVRPRGIMSCSWTRMVGTNCSYAKWRL